MPIFYPKPPAILKPPGQYGAGGGALGQLYAQKYGYGGGTDPYDFLIRRRWREKLVGGDSPSEPGINAPFASYMRAMAQGEYPGLQGEPWNLPGGGIYSTGGGQPPAFKIKPRPLPPPETLASISRAVTSYRPTQRMRYSGPGADFGSPYSDMLKRLLSARSGGGM